MNLGESLSHNSIENELEIDLLAGVAICRENFVLLNSS